MFVNVIELARFFFLSFQVCMFVSDLGVLDSDTRFATGQQIIDSQFRCGVS